jgi:hypothetical protein
MGDLASGDGESAEAGEHGPQQIGAQTVPAQITAPAVAHASILIVSIGANDVQWSDMLRICAVSSNCDNAAEQAYFQSHLVRFPWPCCRFDVLPTDRDANAGSWFRWQRPSLPTWSGSTAPVVAGNGSTSGSPERSFHESIPVANHLNSGIFLVKNISVMLMMLVGLPNRESDRLQ